jgi:hypothetical protein
MMTKWIAASSLIVVLLSACVSPQILPPEPGFQPGARIGLLVQLAKTPVVTQHRSQFLSIKRVEHRASLEWDLQTKATQALAETFRRSGYNVVVLDPVLHNPSELDRLIVRGETGWVVSKRHKAVFENLHINERLAGLVILREEKTRWIQCVPGVIAPCIKDQLYAGLFSQIAFGYGKYSTVPGYRFNAFSFEPLGDLRQVDHLAQLEQSQMDPVQPENYEAPDDPRFMTQAYFEPVVNTIVKHLKLLARQIAGGHRLGPGERALRDGKL